MILIDKKSYNKGCVRNKIERKESRSIRIGHLCYIALLSYSHWTGPIIDFLRNIICRVVCMAHWNYELAAASILLNDMCAIRRPMRASLDTAMHSIRRIVAILFLPKRQPSFRSCTIAGSA